MNRIVDVVCPNGHEQVDVWVRGNDYPACHCGGQTERLWVAQNLGGVIADEIPGGVLIHHGLCNSDGSPRRYYSKTEMKREAARRGLRNHVEHVVDPTSGSDKSPHTSRWV